MKIKIDDLRSAEIHALLQEHLHGMALHSPAGSMHALDIEGLRQPEVTFWTAWDDDTLLGCGALKRLTDDHAELKSMRTDSAHLRRGVARALLLHILEEARGRGFARISLETGSAKAFEPAQALYRSSGFRYCGPFGDYVEDPFSVFMTRAL